MEEACKVEVWLRFIKVGPMSTLILFEMEMFDASLLPNYPFHCYKDLTQTEGKHKLKLQDKNICNGDLKRILINHWPQCLTTLQLHVTLCLNMSDLQHPFPF